MGQSQVDVVVRHGSMAYSSDSLAETCIYPPSLQSPSLSSSSSPGVHLAGNLPLKQRKRHGHTRDHAQGKRKPRISIIRTLGSQVYIYCTCAVSYTADCAAVCCCPLALIHLLMLTLVKLPYVVVWRIMASLKKHMCTRPSVLEDDANAGECRCELDSKRSWLYRECPDALDPASHVVRFDTQALLKHFDVKYLDFGGMSLRRN